MEINGLAETFCSRLGLHCLFLMCRKFKPLRLFFQPEYTEDPLYGKWEAGIKFQVHSPDVPPQVDVYGQSVGVGLWASAAIHKTQVYNN